MNASGPPGHGAQAAEPPALAALGPAGRWTLHEARSEEDEQLLALFADAFGTRMPLAQWQWKYRKAPMRGLLLRRAGEAVAFFGGMPRAMHRGGAVLAAVQNGDVMVAPAERGVFTREGALYQVAAQFFERFVGAGRPYAAAYGFPNDRHFRLGEKLGLYRKGGQMLTMTWSPLLAAGPSRWQQQASLQPDNLALLDRLWRAMPQQWPGHTLPVRNAAQWNWRYLDHPTHRYELIVLRRRWTGRPLCALVLRDGPGHVEWLDYAGPPGAIAQAVAIARHFAAGRGGKPLVALVSHSIHAAFGADAATCEPAMPVALARASDASFDTAPLWLMGGDTDFL